MAFKAPATGIAQQGKVFMSPLVLLRGGINNSISDDLIDNTQLSDARNYMPDHLNAGLLIKRPGLTPVSGNGVQSEVVTSIYQGRNGNFFTTSSTIKQFGSDVDLAGGALGSTTEPDWATFDELDIYVDGSNTPKQVAAGPIVSALPGSPPVFRFIQSYNNRLYGAGHPGAERSIRYTTLGAGVGDWDVLNQFDLLSYGDCTGLTKYQNMLIYFTRESFHSIRHGTGDSDVGIGNSFVHEGSTSHRSIVGTPYGLFWWSDSGLVRNMVGTFGVLDYPAQRLIPNTIESLNRDRYTKVHGVWHKRLQCVQMFVASRGINYENLSIWYFPERHGIPESIWVMDGVGAQMGASGFVTISGVYDVYIGSAQVGGYLYKQDLDSEDDNGIPIRGFIDTKFDATEYGPDAVKRTSNFTVKFITGGIHTVDYSIIIDDHEQPTKTWTLTVGDVARFVLDVSQLDIDAMGGEDIAVEFPIGREFEFHKIKHRIIDSASRRTKIRGVTTKGTLSNV